MNSVCRLALHPVADCPSTLPLREVGDVLICIYRGHHTASQQAQEKLELKQRKLRVAELEQLIRQEAEALEAGESSL
jgi:hypothetical protein